MEEKFLNELIKRHQNAEKFPASGSICDFTTALLMVLFPAMSEKQYFSREELAWDYTLLKESLKAILTHIESINQNEVVQLVDNFMDQVPEVLVKLLTDIATIVQADPAAGSEFEVIRTYPGFYAIAMYRIAHELHKLNIPILPRIITEFAHSKTGIDIHPGAIIGDHFCIDHGTGIVIGETTVIGKFVKLYQGVTLGALSVDKSMAQSKRHPTLEDYVVIYSGATILGGNTVIGTHSVIGGNVWLTKSIPASSTVYYKAHIEVGQDAQRIDL
jgi:serine O-acetyltransferase